MSSRVFFPLDRRQSSTEPFMRQAARRLVELAEKNLETSRTLDMSRFVCVVPASRAKRTLAAYLLDFVEKDIKEGKFDPDWTPPEILLLGQTPETLYDPSAIYGRPIQIANDVTRAYCESRALRRFLTESPFRANALALFPVAPQDDAKAKHAALVADPKEALKLAQTFLTLDQNLANERKNWRDAADACRELGFADEVRRWEAVGALRELYLEEIQRCNRIDRNDAREHAIQENLVGKTDFDLVDGVPKEYFVVGAVDLNRQQKDFFNALGDRVQFWVYAPVPRERDGETPFARAFKERREDFFDDYGCVVPDMWRLEPEKNEENANFLKLSIPIPDENIFLVETPEEQGKAVALLTRELSLDENVAAPRSDADYAPLDPESLTIGAPDLEVVPFVEERMKEIGYATIHGEGAPVVQNRVYRVLELVARYLETRSFDVFGELLRRPDVERWLRRVWDSYELPVPKEETDSAPEETPEEARQRELNEALAAEEDEALAEEAESGGDVQDASVGASTAGRALWLDEFDEYRSKFLPTRVGSRWFKIVDEEKPKRNRYFYELRKASYIVDQLLAPFFGDDRAPRLYNSLAKRDESGVREAFDAENGVVETLKITPELVGKLLERNVEYATRQKKQPLAKWAETLATLLENVYPNDETRPDFDEQSQIDGFFKLFNNELTELHRVPFVDVDGNELRDVVVSGSLAIRAVLSVIRGKSVAPAPNQRVVEIQGWLDLLFDDAPYCVLTGFNERVVPSTISGDLFLPNETRKKLGLSDASRVFARDAYLAYTLACSRDAFFVVLEKRTLKKDPRLPSRFLFAVPDERVPQRVVRYFGDGALQNFENLERRHKGVPFPLASLDSAPNGVPSRNSDKNDSSISTPPVLTLPSNSPFSWSSDGEDPLDSASPERKTLVLDVTDFESFLHSPYRFFLKKAFRLNPATRNVNEFDAAKFGTLVHDVLSEFGRDDSVKNSTDEYVINAWLSKRLDEHAAKSVDDFTAPFARVQIEELRARLRSFAAWQAEWRQLGYEIVRVEDSYDLRCSYLRCGAGGDERVDATKINGRIDRVDYNARENRYFVFDYKTFDSGRKGSENKTENPEEIVSKQGETLLTNYVDSEVDRKHRQLDKKSPGYPKSFDEIYAGQGVGNAFSKRWINLQLPLYRRFFEKKERLGNDANVSLGYIVLTKSEIQALAAPWDEDELRGADYMCRWVVEQIWRFCDLGKVEPRTPSGEVRLLDGFLPILADERLNNDDFAPITLSYLDPN